MYVFIDESGDLGFDEKSSRNFVVAILLCKEPNRLRKIVRAVKQSISKKWKKIPELKANNSNHKIRVKMLEAIADQEVKIYCVRLRKQKVVDKLKDKKEKMFNWISGTLLSACKFDSKEIEIKIVVDKRMSKEILRDDFDHYIKVIKLPSIANKITIKHESSQNERGIQAADFVSWTVFRKYESDDDKYYNIIKKKIEADTQMF